MPKNINRADIQLGLAYDRAFKQARLFLILLLISTAINIALISAIVIMMPLKEIKPYFMPIGTAGDHYYRIIPADKLKRSQIMELTRDYIKRYVIDRHTVDYVTETIRFGRIKAQSNAKVFEQVKNEYRRFQERLPDVKREIEIISDIQLEPYYHQIEFKTIDRTNDDRQFEKYWVVNIRYELAGFNSAPIEMNADEVENNPNPLGMVITGYSWTERRNVKEKGFQND